MLGPGALTWPQRPQRLFLWSCTLLCLVLHVSPLCVIGKMAASSPGSLLPGLALTAEAELLPPQTPVLSRKDVDDCASILDAELGTCEGVGMLCPEGLSGQCGIGGREVSSQEPEEGSAGRQTLQLSWVTTAKEGSCRESRPGS